MSDFDTKLNQFFAKLDTAIKQQFPAMLAETAVEHYKNALTSKRWDGKAYPAYKNPAKEPRRGSLMMRSNKLFMSIKPSLVSPAKVIISAGNSRVPYARIHNEGLRINGRFEVRAHTNRNFMGKGKRVDVKAHSRKVNYTMPQRQFMGKSPLLLQEIKDRFKRNFKDNLRGA